MLDTLTSLANLFGPRADPEALVTIDPQLYALSRLVVRALGRYFRAEVAGLDRIPAGPALLVLNHNAGITNMDPFLLAGAWDAFTLGRDPFRFLAHDVMLRLPVVGNYLMRTGAIRADHGAGTRALAAGHKVVVFPGGNYEAFRPYRDRHRIDFGRRRGFIKLALRTQVPIVPVVCVGGHESFFVLRRGTVLARLLGAHRRLRSESFPIFVGLPWGLGVGPVFHLPLPTKCVLEVGEPLALDEFAPADADDPAAVERIFDDVVGTMQTMLARGAARRRWPVLG
jgi:1-acyl-sn-glycerol-3-phosphate acyltransferase